MSKSSTKPKVVDVPARAAISLAIAPETVFFIITKARELDVKVAPSESGSGENPADHQQREVLEERLDDPTQAELRSAIDGLNADEKADLVAMLWLGRGDFEAEEWQDARAQAFEQQQHVARYLMGNPQLGDLLEEGFTSLGYSTEEFELGRL